MRKLFLGCAWFAVCTGVVHADDPVGTLSEPKLGEWGYRHHELHEYGIPEQMGGDACCSGVDGGECRATKINLQKREIYVNGQWCFITPEITIQRIPLPNGIEAVVCAGKNDQPQQMKCPGLYCVATNPDFASK